MKKLSAIIASALVVAILAAGLLALPASAAQKKPDTSRQPNPQAYYERTRAYWYSTDGLCKGESVFWTKGSGKWAGFPCYTKDRGVKATWATSSTDGQPMDYIRCSGAIEVSLGVYYADVHYAFNATRVEPEPYDTGNMNVPTGNWKGYAGHEYVRGASGQYGWSDPINTYNYTRPGCWG
jgi:hypothetical protein